jgi:hypothetical protein
MSKVTSSNSDSDSGAWSISVKAVGGEHLPQNEAGGFAERDFNVTVSPDDELSSLYEQIEGVTGLKASQQRLIYRGRLIGAISPTPPPKPPPSLLVATVVSNENNENTDGTITSELQLENIEGASNSPTTEKHKIQKIKDIVGLGDGQTIHLVKKRDTPQAERPRDEATVGISSTVGENAPSESGSPAPMAGNGTASLLAALLGLGSLEDGGGAGGSGSGGDEHSEDPSSRSWRANRVGSRRRVHYRLSEEDVRDVPDPGSAEPVRQSMMTLHTLLPHAQQATAATTGTIETHEQQRRQQQLQSPLDFQRRWYRGQWVDCRDTVNQWLEATVVDIIHPDDILPPHSEDPSIRPTTSQSPTINPANDPAVTAGDLEGRRRLLLEPCMEGCSGDLGGELTGFRPRATNDGVQMILLHYNGWPHRWDEWIRSDSERLRPFRVRTRHPNRSTHASPTPQTLFNEAPSTFIRSEVEAQDREALLPELGRILTAVNELVAHAAASTRPLVSEASPCADSDLPWTSYQQQGDREQEDDDDDLEELTSLDSPAPLVEVASVESAGPPSHPGLNRRELETLAPLLDRLGRTLIDAAPHVASLAASLPDPYQAEEVDDIPELEPVDEHPSTLGGLLSLLSRDRRRASTTSSSQLVVAGDNASAITPSVQTGATSEAALSVDPDYTDFVTGLVNTSRGEVRAGPRSLRASQNNGDDLSNVLGAYLAAASMGGGDAEGGDDNGNSQGLGRLLRERGNGGGIDIHIHAVVTSPGGLPGNIGLATLGGSPPTTAGNVFSHNRDRRSNGPLLRLRAPAVLPEEDDNGIFSALYSENPTPINPNQSPSDRNRQGDSSRSNDAGTQHARSRLARSRSEAGALSAVGPRSSRGGGSSSSRRSNGRTSNRGMLNRFFRRSNNGA